MIQLILDGLIHEDCGLTPEELDAEASKIQPFLNAFQQRDQGFVLLPKSKAMLLAVKSMAEKYRGDFERGDLENIVILGVGGSALGTTCLRDALLGPYWNFHGQPRLFVLDNLDMVAEAEKVIDLDKTLFVVVSKSGTTPETMAQYFYFRSKVPRKQFVFITLPNSGVLREIGEREGIPTLDHPENVGGRFAVLTAVGLFPAALLGLDIEELLEGAEAMAESFYQTEMDRNLPFQLATAQYLLDWKHGIRMSVMMPYSTRLLSLADWYRQLLAESIGKDGKGLTPVRALGVTDQHSQLQLYNEGPRDKLLMFLRVAKEDSPVIPPVEPEKLNYLSGVSFTKLMQVEQEATEQAVRDYKKPSLRIEIPEVSARSLGELFMLFEASIAFLGEYYKIDAFNQPGVELGKKLTKKLLSNETS